MSKTAQIGNNTGIKCSMKSLYPGHLWEMCHLVSSLCLEHMRLLLHILFVTDPSAVTWCVIALKHKVPGHTGNINTFVLAKSKSVLYLEGKKKEITGMLSIKMYHPILVHWFPMRETKKTRLTDLCSRPCTTWSTHQIGILKILWVP